MKEGRRGPHIDQRRCAIVSAATLRNLICNLLRLVEWIVQHQLPRRRHLLERDGRKILPDMDGIRIVSERPIGMRPNPHSWIVRYQWVPVVVRQEVLIQKVRR